MHRQAVGLIARHTPKSKQLKVHLERTEKLLLELFAEVELHKEIVENLRSQDAGPSRKATGDRRHVSKARVITTEDVWRWKEKKDAEAREKEAKKNARENKKKAVTTTADGIITPKRRARKQVRIVEEVSVRLFEEGTAGSEVTDQSDGDTAWSEEDSSDDAEFMYIQDVVESPTPRRRHGKGAQDATIASCAPRTRAQRAQCRSKGSAQEGE